jgi:hypothetical protein
MNVEIEPRNFQKGIYKWDFPCSVVFNRVYRLEIQSVMLVFSTNLVN